MKKLFVLLFAGAVFILIFMGCSSSKVDDQKARVMLENAVFSPDQVFSRHKNFYMRTERMIDEASAAGKYISALNKESYSMNALFENKVVQELYIQDNNLRLSCYVESLTTPLELHFIYDGQTMWTVSNFAAKDSQQMTFAQAKSYIGFPGSGFFKRIRSEFEESGKEILYKHSGTQKYNGYRCDVVEMGLNESSDKKAVFFIDQKTNVVVKADWTGIFNNVAHVKKIGRQGSAKFPAISEVMYGEYFTAIVKYSVKTDEYIHPDIFKESNILLPLRSMFKESRFQNEKPEQRRLRIRVVLDSIQSFDVVLRNMHLTDTAEHSGSEYESKDEGIVLPDLDKKLIPENLAAYRIPIAAEEAPKPEEKKKLSVKPKAKPAKKKAPETKKDSVQTDDENDETDFLEYSPRDAYKSIDAELEDMKEKDPESYEKMKKIVEEMKAKDANIKKMAE